MDTMSSHRKWLAAAYTVGVVLIVALADTGRLGPVHALVRSVPLGDKALHLIAMGGLALVAELATGAPTLRAAGVPLRVASAVVLVVVVLEELSQRWLPSRSFDYGDLAADLIGIALGGAIGARLATARTTLTTG